MKLVTWLKWLARDRSLEARRARRWIKLLFVLALFVTLFFFVPIQSVVQAMLNANPFYWWLGVLVGFIGVVMTAFEMEPLIRKQGIPHGAGSILAINLSVKFYTQFTPTTLLASGLRWYRLSKPGDKTAEALAALAFFRLLETFLTFALGLGFWLGSARAPDVLTVSWVVALCVGVIVVWIVLTRYSLPVYMYLKQRSGFLDRYAMMRPVLNWLEKFVDAIAAYADMRAWDLFVSIFWGLMSILAGIVSGQVIAWAVGIHLSFMEMGWIQAVVLFASQLPFTVAGGLGVREVTLVAILGSFGFTPELALAYSFLLGIRGVLLSLPGGVVEVARILRDRQTAPAPSAPPQNTREH